MVTDITSLGSLFVKQGWMMNAVSSLKLRALPGKSALCVFIKPVSIWGGGNCHWETGTGSWSDQEEKVGRLILLGRECSGFTPLKVIPKDGLEYPPTYWVIFDGLDQRSANIFFKELKSKYFWICGSSSLSCNYSTQPFEHENPLGPHKHKLNQWLNWITFTIHS